MFIPGFLVPIFLSIGLASVLVDDSFITTDADPAEGIGVWILAAFLFAAWLGLRRFVPIPRGGFFWQTAVIVSAFLVAGLVSPNVPSMVTGLLAVALLVGLHLARLAVEIGLAERRYA